MMITSIFFNFFQVVYRVEILSISTLLETLMKIIQLNKSAQIKCIIKYRDHKPRNK